MSWHDPDRSGEPAEESALREELRGLLGVPARDARNNYFETEPSPELIMLADDLRREALRRNRTARKRNSWMLAAAALPFAVALGGVGAWGVAQKHKADQLAANVAEAQTRIQRLATALQAQPAAAPQPAAPAPAARIRPPQVMLVGKTTPKARPKELIIPVERNADTSVNDTQRVKAH
jgi:outer membrane murein-binding lipoprotein Lpp